MKKKKKLKRIFLVLLGALLLLYIGLANILVSAALVPSFMERLEAFSRITEESVDALVHTDDIEQQYEKSWEDTQEWAKNAHGQKLTKETEDGYNLVAQEVYTEEESHKWVLLLHGYTGWKEAMYPFAMWYNQRGYHVIAPDMRCQGESEGEPRYIEDPTSRVEDIRSAVDYLVSLPYVDEEKIGAMGVCAGAGYTMSAIQTEYRIKAAAGISTWNTGHSARFATRGCTMKIT